MWRRIGLVIGCITLGGALALATLLPPRPAQSQPSLPAAAKWDPALAQALAQAAPDARLRCLVYLSDQPDWGTAAWPVDRHDRRAAVVYSLQQLAAETQADLRVHLAQQQAQGAITAYRPYWIFNGIWVEGSPAAIQALGDRDEVARLALDVRRQYLTTTLSAAPPLTPWGLAQIGAPYVHAGLGISGTGVTVAVMDTGADWLHPALFDNYRGQHAGVIDHTGHWYDATQVTNTTPVDPHGHGTHVLGSAVGGLGIGVAPGARWIAVRVFDAYGFAYTSDIHAGFEWLLAPAGDPALAPDIVNGSWGSTPTSAEWLNDLTALRAAGILPVFAAGNAGPTAMSVATPAGYPDVLAVAASDELDQIAWFSSLGPSLWTAQTKPTLAAPGAGVVSAYPGGGYAISSGTSMAAPHVSGALALLLSSNPALDATAATHILTTTAHPLSTTHPNPVSGWGRLDVYAAVAGQAIKGTVAVEVSAQGIPVPQAAVTVTTPAGVSLVYVTDAAGRFEAALAPGVYTVATAPFGYAPVSVSHLVAAGQTTPVPLALTSLPAGQVQGVVREVVTGAPLPARVEVVGAPAATQADAQGIYSLLLPAGVHTLRAVLTGQRILTTVVTIEADQNHTQDFALERAPRILLVDSGQWYYLSKIDYYRAALEANAYAFDEWAVRHPIHDTPTLSDVADYAVLVWSAPNDAPGLIGAGRVISDYLGLGGNFLISGQDVAFYDGNGLGAQRWWYDLLHGQYAGKTTPLSVTGAANTPLAGLAFELNGGSSANNQLAPDHALPLAGSLAEVVLTYADGQGAALAAGPCDPYRILYLGFGLEGVAEAADRAQVLGRALDYFQAPRTRAGVQFVTPSLERFAVAGAHLTYTLEVRNLSEWVTDTITLALEGGRWSYELITPTLTLGPCQTGRTALVVQAPLELAPGITDVVSVTAGVAGDPSLSAFISVTHQAPNAILFVADHRWYDQAALYRPLLDELGLVYDYWEIGAHEEVLGSPSAEMLAAYDMVLWYTGYDWFQPITPAESEALVTYLAGGGRLFLTSQDYMYYHAQDPLTRDYLGVQNFYESITPTQVYVGHSAGRAAPVSATLPLTYGVYQNFSDGLIPRPGARPVLWHSAGMPGAVANQGEGWRTLLWGLPFETLPSAAHVPVARAIVGWLSDLGDSALTSSVRVVTPGDWHTYTLALHNQVSAPANSVTATLYLPPELRIDIPKLSTEWLYDALNHQLQWAGRLLPGQSLTLTYRGQAEETAPAGTLLATRARLVYTRHQIAFDLQARVWVATPDLTPSTLSYSPATWRPGAPVTLSLSLVNAGPTPAAWISATLFLPPELQPMTSTLVVISGTTVVTGRQVQWRASARPGETVTLSLQATVASQWPAGRLPLLAVVDDQTTAPIVRFQLALVEPWQRFFPVVWRE